MASAFGIFAAVALSLAQPAQADPVEVCVRRNLMLHWVTPDPTSGYRGGRRVKADRHIYQSLFESGNPVFKEPKLLQDRDPNGYVVWEGLVSFADDPGPKEPNFLMRFNMKSSRWEPMPTSERLEDEVLQVIFDRYADQFPPEAQELIKKVGKTLPGTRRGYVMVTDRRGREAIGFAVIYDGTPGLDAASISGATAPDLPLERLLTLMGHDPKKVVEARRNLKPDQKIFELSRYWLDGFREDAGSRLKTARARERARKLLLGKLADFAEQNSDALFFAHVMNDAHAARNAELGLMSVERFPSFHGKGEQHVLQATGAELAAAIRKNLIRRSR